MTYDKHFPVITFRKLAAAQRRDHVSDGDKWMVQEHTGTGEPHHPANMFSHLRVVTMHRTPGAKRFMITLRTVVDTIGGIGE